MAILKQVDYLQTCLYRLADIEVMNWRKLVRNTQNLIKVVDDTALEPVTWCGM